MRFSRRLLCRLLVLSLAAAALPISASRAAEAKSYDEMVAKAVEFLSTKGQADDGSFSQQASPAVTAIVVESLLKQGRSPDDPVVAKGLKYLEGLAQPDGGIYRPGTFHQNYETCISVMAFQSANKDGRYADLIKRADAYLRDIQNDEGEGHGKESLSYGGAGYGRSKRPDLSNTSFLLDALKATGAGPDDPAVQKALVFVSQCQNLESPYNTGPWAAKNPDGGFYYTAAAGGQSQAGQIPDGGLRSYGSMTYAGLKSMIYAGVGPDDPRVKAALAWLKKHYSLTENPGMGDSSPDPTMKQAGLYYYYNTFAKALAALGEDKFVDDTGTAHDWRSELIAELAKRQQPDGSWINEQAKWMEGDPNLVTAYALLALHSARAK
ncbi:MAG: prenyltransferase/squalene oxidase repeat-containing protein [Pirellulales bacterium]